MRLSARNIIRGNVEKIEKGDVTAVVKVKIETPVVITSVITRESIEDLNLKEGDEAVVVIKSTEVMIGKE
jgi:molybdopterin-binding protein